MALQKLNIPNKTDNAAKKKLVASNEIGVNETLMANEVNALVAKTNELVDAYNFGAPITAFNFKENVPTYADLPLVGNEVNDGYGVIADGLVYVWNGEAFQPDGSGLDLGLKPAENSKVEEGNMSAVNGNNVFALKQNILEDYVGTSKLEEATATYLYDSNAVTNSNTLYSFFGYIDQSQIKDKKIKSIKVAVSTAGTFSIMRVLNYKQESETIVKKTTYNVGVGENVLEFNDNLLVNESLVFFADTDTARFLYTLGSSDPVNNFSFKTKSTGLYSNVTNTLNIQVIYSGDFVLPYKISDKIADLAKVNSNYEYEAIPFSNGSAVANPIYEHFIYNCQDVIRNKPIKSIRINVSQAGTFTVMKGRNISLPTFSFEEIQTFNTVNGINILIFDTDFVINNDEYLIFGKSTDSAVFRYKTATNVSNRGNPIGLGFSFQNISTGAWSAVMGDLCIGVYVEEKSIKDKSISTINKKKISFLGDSITTFNGYVVSGNNVWYPNSDVNTVDKTWWYQLVNELGWEIDTNNSFSGAKISGTTTSAFHNRITNIGSPDVCLIFGGTNDYRDAVPLGDWNFIDLIFDVNVFKQALQKLLHTAITSNPLVKFYYILPLHRNDLAHVNGFPVNFNKIKYLKDYQLAIIEGCELYGVEIIDARAVISQYNANDLTIDGLHPNTKGMQVLKDFVLKKIR